jgi:lipoprotein-anchoring transpeptidase ErfK/SrfK
VPTADQSAAIVKLQVLLDRANASPGAIDGLPGENLANAMAAFEKRKGLPGAGALTSQALSALEAGGQSPIVQTYVITAADEKGPFLHKLPASMFALSKLPHLGYLDPAQELAERFHMSPGLLKAMNPGVDFAVAGQSIHVVAPGSGEIGGAIARIVVDKTTNQVRAYGGTGKVLASFPATVGSTERPAPTGKFAVKSVTPNPDYIYDPSKLTFGNKSHGKFTIRPGPNNPVGTTWIALTLPTYGIHGTDDPDAIGKVASHGCVRLTNWDAAELGHAVAKGVPVDFIGKTEKS